MGIIYLIVCIILSLINLSQGNYSQTPNAIIYAKTSNKRDRYNYKSAPYLWDDIKDEIKDEIKSICVNGTFILYQSPGFKDYNPENIRILSGIDKCVEPGPVSYGSYQAVNTKSNESPVIAVFEESLLQGQVFPIYGKTVLGWSRSSTVKSFLLQGKDIWNVLTITGQTFCLSPNQSSLEWPLCIVLDVTSKKFQIPTRWMKVEKGCPKGAKVTTIQVDNCRESFSGKLELIDYSESYKGKFKRQSVFNATQKSEVMPINMNDCNKNKEILGLLSYLQFNDFSSDLQPYNPKNKEFVAFLYSFELSVDILLELCSIVSPIFLQIVRELFIAKMEDLVWSKRKMEIIGNQEYNKIDPNLDSMLTDCMVSLEESGQMFEYRRTSEIRLSRKQLHEVWQVDDFVKDNQYLAKLPCKNETADVGHDCPIYNSMQEALHLIFNTVAAACHIALDFQTNFFTDYALAFKSFYLDPLTDHWIETKAESMRLDPLVFAGLSVTEELQGLGVCAANVFRRVPNLEMYDRDVKLSDPLRRKKK